MTLPDSRQCESWTMEEFHEYQRTGKTPTRNRTTSSASDVESIAERQSLGAEENPRFRPPVRIGIISYRQRLADTDGVSAKAAIDGLVKAGILEGDTATIVKEVWYQQVKAKEEKTLITIEEI